jgi:hypothetical protein
MRPPGRPVIPPWRTQVDASHRLDSTPDLTCPHGAQAVPIDPAQVSCEQQVPVPGHLSAPEARPAPLRYVGVPPASRLGRAATFPTHSSVRRPSPASWQVHRKNSSTDPFTWRDHQSAHTCHNRRKAPAPSTRSACGGNGEPASPASGACPSGPALRPNITCPLIAIAACQALRAVSALQGLANGRSNASAASVGLGCVLLILGSYWPGWFSLGRLPAWSERQLWSYSR